MKHHTIIILLILILGGCATPGKGKDTNTQTPDSYVVTGTQGLELNFEPGLPPSRIRGEELPIRINVRNLGKIEVTNAKIVLGGYDQNIITGFTGSSISGSTIRIHNLPPRTFLNQQGGYMTYTITGTIAQNVITGTYSPTITATACYTYKTEASANLCIDPNPYNNEPNKPCRLGQVNLLDSGNGQGAPVQITNVNVDSSTKTMTITFYIRNSGGGSPFDSAKLSECPQGLTPNNRDKIKVDSVKVGSTDITSNCQPGRELTLYQGSGVLVCTYDLPSSSPGAYMTELSIVLSYGYTKSIMRRVEITKS